MLYIETIICNMLQENCYVVSDETNECVIIDCGAYYEKDRQAIINHIKSNNLIPKHLLATHGHIDHNLGSNMIYGEYGLLPEISVADKELMDILPQQAEALLGIQLKDNIPTAEKYFNDGDTINFGNHQLKVIHTPGHTKGSVIFYCEEENKVFSGDTIFKGSIGRTDLPGGSMFDMMHSLRIISQLPDSTIIYPGHGPITDIGYELAHNPYMDR